MKRPHPSPPQLRRFLALLFVSALLGAGPSLVLGGKINALLVYDVKAKTYNIMISGAPAEKGITIRRTNFQAAGGGQTVVSPDKAATGKDGTYNLPGVDGSKGSSFDVVVDLGGGKTETFRGLVRGGNGPVMSREQQADKAKGMLRNGLGALPLDPSDSFVFDDLGSMHDQLQLENVAPDQPFQLTSFSVYQGLDSSFFNTPDFDQPVAIATGQPLVEILEGIALDESSAGAGTVVSIPFGPAALDRYQLVLGKAAPVLPDGSLGAEVPFSFAHQVPEPQTFVLLALGAIALAARRRCSSGAVRAATITGAGIAFGLGLAGWSHAQLARVYVGKAANAVPIVDQHPLARGEAVYDTHPKATGIYNRNVDVTGKRYDASTDYYNDKNADTLKTSLINGGWYCFPTASLSLVKHWDTDPRFPNLFAGKDTDRSVILDLAGRMDTDDLTARGPPDPAEVHLGTLGVDVLPGIFGYFQARYPNQFKAEQRLLAPGPAGANAFGAIYDNAILNNIPVNLGLSLGHSVVGIGFDPNFGFGDPRHYVVHDPWDARTDISIAQVGNGRGIPLAARAVYGSLANDLYGDGADVYDEGPQSVYLPDSMYWVEPVPEPATATLALIGGAMIAGRALRRRSRGDG